ncbi:DMT family transporter [uncultured Brevundimonas sp.]|uniref:DMT family transporter n=1 Tax=uncultured Brevundimonas sp. TaxID=213418 RepID=UPI0025ECF242|nr:DMT family transporter [uncultured Brevundimonas sp.]
MQSQRFWGVASGMAAGALWGLVFLAPKVAPEASPMMLTAGRYLAYGLIAALLIAPRWRRVTAALDFKAWRALAWLSLAGNIVYFVFLVVSVHFAGVGASALIVGMVPVVVALWGLKDKASPPLARVAPPIAVAALAVGLIGWESLSKGSGTGHDGVQTLIGLACALAALLSWSAFAVGNSRWMGRLPDVSPHDWSLLTGVVTGGFALLLAVPAVLTMGVWSGEAWVRFLGVSLGVAVFASIIGNAFWNQASRLLPLTMLGQMIVSETLFAFLYGFLWEGRGPTVIEITAMILMVVSVVWCVRAHRPSALAAAEGDH